MRHVQTIVTNDAHKLLRDKAYALKIPMRDYLQIELEKLARRSDYLQSEFDKLTAVEASKGLNGPTNSLNGELKKEIHHELQ